MVVKVKKNLKYFLKGKLTDKELELLNRSFRLLGNIAIVEIPKELVKKDKVICKAILDMNKSVSTVLRKHGHVGGIYRTRQTKFVLGKRTKIATFRENGCVFSFNVDDTFFSSGMGSERKRIASLVKKNEDVLVLFSGVAPCNCVISKNSEAKSVYGIDINKKAHEFGLEHVRLNKLDNVFLYEGDFRKVLPRLKKKFDRIVMIHPGLRLSLVSVPFTLKYLKKGGFLHVYDFIPSYVDEKWFVKFNLDVVFSGSNRNFKLLNIHRLHDVTPTSYEVCYDIRVL